MLAKREWSQEDDDVLAMMVMDAIRVGKTSEVYTSIAAELDITNPDIVRKRARELMLPNVRLNRQALGALWERTPLPDLSKEVLRVEAERGVFGSDLHEPYMNRELFYEFLDDCQGADLAAVVGDLTQSDAFSKFASRGQEVDNMKTTTELVMQDIDLILQVAERLLLMPGNHDFFLTRATDGALAPFAMLEPWAKEKYGERVIFSKFPFAYAEVGGQKWMLHHPDTYRVTPGSVARDFCSIYESNIACGHSHITSETVSKSGRYAVDIGGLVDERLVPYRHYTDRPYGRWSPGWLIVDKKGHTLRNRANAGEGHVVN